MTRATQKSGIPSTDAIRSRTTRSVAFDRCRTSAGRNKLDDAHHHTDRHEREGEREGPQVLLHHAQLLVTGPCGRRKAAAQPGREG